MDSQPLDTPPASPHALGAPEPDFLCVGMEKAATRWAYDQLRWSGHPDFWMPPVKELRYLSSPAPGMDSTVRMVAQQSRGRGAARSEADDAFLSEAAALAGRPRDLEKYGALFRFKGDRISGDISPGYGRLSPDDIALVAGRFPNLRVFLMVREPVERAWSHLCQRYRTGRFDVALLEDAARFSSWFGSCAVKRASFATQVLNRWTAAAPRIAFRHFFFDHVAQSPNRARAELIAFLGGDPDKNSGDLPPGYNHKSNAPKLALPDAIKAVLVEQLADEICASARLFGGPAEEWPARHGL
ncbi:MAG TPA: hypothetical protein VLC74_10155 [Rhizomicrobium sp.]|nr:hypothetical protein [Rhizomicrobium sp.]